jgi:hypothetical protein
VKRWRASPQGRETAKKYRQTNGRFANVSNLARRQGKEWALTEEAWQAIISAPCFYCGLPNDSGFGAGMDRLNNMMGYIEGNVVSCCYECNTARSDNFSPEEMRVVGAAIRAIKLRRQGS